MMQHWYERDGDRLVAAASAAGPVKGLQHGGAVAAVVARAADAAPSPVPMDIVRLTVDLSRRVPLGVTETIVNSRRAGKRVQVLEVTVVVDGVECGRSEVLRMRRGDILDPAGIRAEDRPVFDLTRKLPVQPWSVPLLDLKDQWFEESGDGRGVYWLRAREQMIGGEEMSPATRAAVAADMVMTAGSTFPHNASLNADLTVSFHRMPVGEWFRVSSTVYANPGGWGTSVGTLSDLEGPFAHVTKSVLYDEYRENSHY